MPNKNIKIRPEILVCLFLVLSILIVYWQVINYEFVGFDDDLYVTGNSNVKDGLTVSSIIWAFKSTYASNWHPLTWVSHMLDVQLYGMNPGSHHTTNVLFHIVNSMLLFIVFKRMTGRIWQSGLIAVLFALHPLHVESVAWVAERKDVLSTFFWFLTLYCYIWYVESPGFGRYIPVFLFFVLGLMAKPMLVTLPFVLLLLDYWPLRRFQFRHSEDNSRNSFQMSLVLPMLWEKAPFFILSIASGVVTIFVQKTGGAIGSLEVYPFTTRIANVLVSYVNYIGKMVWPSSLSVLYPYQEKLAYWQVAGAFILLVSISLLGIKALQQKPWFTVGWLWYVVTLVPVIGLVQIGTQAMADRYTYVPLIGLFIIIAWGVPELMSNWHYKTKGLAIISATVFLILIRTSSIQVSYWKNSISLYEHAISVTSNNYIIHNNLGFALTARGKWGDAIKNYQEALKINPDFETANLNLGITLLAQGKFDKCVEYYQEVLQVKPHFAKVHNNLGNMLLRKGEIENAIDHFREALRIKQDYAEAYNGLGASMMFKEEINEAIALFQEALRIKPDYIEAQNNLTKTLATMKIVNGIQ